ncbi:hypothetical protein BZA70DRAFT_290027 [Myxozyma melibiosi]|uniref:Uncharacterized protein n=1 Tax=Myxozyma melibiosi TaxID=54550 RepID=A0ABR1F6H5_9ASCO
MALTNGTVTNTGPRVSEAMGHAGSVLVATTGSVPEGEPRDDRYLGDPLRLVDYMKSFRAAQATRTELYHEFEEALDDYVNLKISVPQIQQVIRVSQEGFQDVSSEIIILHKLMGSLGQDNLTVIIDRVQDLEKEKLEVTVRLLQARIQAAADTERSFESEIEELTLRRAGLMEQINEQMEEAAAEIIDLETMDL